MQRRVGEQRCRLVDGQACSADRGAEEPEEHDDRKRESGSESGTKNDEDHAKADPRSDAIGSGWADVIAVDRLPLVACSHGNILALCRRARRFMVSDMAG